jgi:Tfp pilus assembly protein FimT
MQFAVCGARLSYDANKAFTLLEVTLVSVIILALVALSMPIFRATYEDLKISSCAKDIARMMNFARERAIFERMDYRFVIDDINNTYQLFIQDEKDKGFRPLTERWGKAIKVPDGIDIESEVKYIDFSSNGVSDSAVINIANKENRVYSISLDGTSGSVKVDDKTE